MCETKNYSFTRKRLSFVGEKREKEREREREREKREKREGEKYPSTGASASLLMVYVTRDA